MIEVRFGEREFEMVGHAMEAEGPEYRQVCAGASALAYTLCYNLYECGTSDALDIDVIEGESGHVRCRWDGDADGIVRVVFVGFWHMARDYPEYMRLVDERKMD